MIYLKAPEWRWVVLGVGVVVVALGVLATWKASALQRLNQRFYLRLGMTIWAAITRDPVMVSLTRFIGVIFVLFGTLLVVVAITAVYPQLAHDLLLPGEYRK